MEKYYKRIIICGFLNKLSLGISPCSSPVGKQCRPDARDLTEIKAMNKSTVFTS